MLADVEEEVLPLGTSLGKHYSPFYNSKFRSYDDHTYDTNNTEVIMLVWNRSIVCKA